MQMKVTLPRSHTKKADSTYGRPDLRFWANVNKKGPVVRPELGRCWVWTGLFWGRDPVIYFSGYDRGYEQGLTTLDKHVESRKRSD